MVSQPNSSLANAGLFYIYSREAEGEVPGKVATGRVVT